MQHALDAETTSVKLTSLLSSLESLLTEIVTHNHGMEVEETVELFQGKFHRSIRANIYYHDRLARIFEVEGNGVNMVYYRRMADLYRSIMTK